MGEDGGSRLSRVDTPPQVRILGAQESPSFGLMDSWRGGRTVLGAKAIGRPAAWRAPTKSQRASSAGRTGIFGKIRSKRVLSSGQSRRPGRYHPRAATTSGAEPAA